MLDKAQQLKVYQKKLDGLLDRQGRAILKADTALAETLYHEAYALHAQISAHAFALAEEVLKKHESPEEKA